MPRDLWLLRYIELIVDFFPLFMVLFDLLRDAFSDEPHILWPPIYFEFNFIGCFLLTFLFHIVSFPFFFFILFFSFIYSQFFFVYFPFTHSHFHLAILQPRIPATRLSGWRLGHPIDSK